MIVFLFIGYNAWYNSQESTHLKRMALLWELPFAPDEPRIIELVSQGADVNFPTVDGKTPLMMAAEQDNVELIISLIRLGANPFKRNDKGDTALEVAIECESLMAFRALSNAVKAR